MKKLLKTRMIVLIIVTGCFGSVKLMETEAASRNVYVSVSSEKISITINGVGSSGTGTLVSYDAYDYHPSDPYKGLSKDNGSSRLNIADYECGSSITKHIKQNNQID